MSEKKDGGPAFPHGNQELGDRHRIASSGMSLRDWFAGQALAGYASGILALPDGEEVKTEWAARYAYEFADAMLAARETKP